MSVLDRFEKSVEGAVNGVFAKFGSKDLKPVDLSSALEREIDKEAMPVTRDRTVAPNEYRFKLSTPDFNNIVEWGAETLANELADNLTQYAKSQNYAFVGPVVVIFEEDLELSKGDYRLSSESVQGNTVPVTTDAQTEDCPMLEIGEHQYLLTEEKTIIGRGSDCDIVIDDPGISRRHMEIDVTDNGNTVIARDLNSTACTSKAIMLRRQRCSTATRSPSAEPASCTGPPRRSRSNQPQPGEPPFMLTELTFAILKYGFLVLLWIFVACTVRSLYRDIETLSPRKSRAHRRKERAARKAVESPAPVAAAAPSASAATNAKPTLLVIIDGPLAGSSVPLAGNTITLGRSASNTVVLDDEFVSSHHARVYTDPATGRWAIEDLGSTNGTVVNHQRLNAPMILGARVPVRIGATTFELR